LGGEAAAQTTPFLIIIASGEAWGKGKGMKEVW